MRATIDGMLNDSGKSTLQAPEPGRYSPLQQEGVAHLSLELSKDPP